MADTTVKLANKVEAAVTTAVEKPSTAASLEAIPVIMNELIPVIEAIVNSTALKPWYLSKTVWAGILSLLATLLAIVGVTFSPELQGTVLTAVLGLMAAVPSGLAFYARWKQNKAAKAAITVTPTK
jgi:protein-S-isoprenylcysteine O-methyltransferase Ste14